MDHDASDEEPQLPYADIRMATVALRERPSSSAEQLEVLENVIRQYYTMYGDNEHFEHERIAEPNQLQDMSTCLVALKDSASVLMGADLTPAERERVRRSAVVINKFEEAFERLIRDL